MIKNVFLIETVYKWKSNEFSKKYRKVILLVPWKNKKKCGKKRNLRGNFYFFPK